MRHIKPYNEVVKYLDDVESIKVSYTKQIEDCILYISDLMDDYSIKLSLITNVSRRVEPFRVTLNSSGISMTEYEDVMDALHKTIDKLKNDLGAGDFIIELESNYNGKNSNFGGLQFVRIVDTSLDGMHDIYGLSGDLVKITIMFK